MYGEWPILILLVCAGIFLFLLRSKSIRCRYVVIFVAIAGACFCLYTFTLGSFENLYSRIQQGMTRDEVYKLLGSAPDTDAIVMLSYRSGESEGSGKAWTRTEWGRPYQLVVGFDADGRVFWKALRKGAFQKLGHWLFDRWQSDCFSSADLTGVEILRGANEDDVRTIVDEK